MPGPLNRLAHTTLPLTPALGAFIGPKQRNIMIVLEMASTAGTCHWVSTAPDGIDTTDEVFSRAPGASLDKAALCLPHWIEQCRWDSMHLAWTPTRPNALPAGRSRTAETYLFANSNQCEPVQHAQQTKLVFRSHSLLLSPRLPAFLPFRFAELVSPLTLIELCFAQSAHALCSACCPLSPLGGGGGCATKEHKKNREGKCVRPRTL